MHPLYGALPGLYVAMRVTRDPLVAYLYTYIPVPQYFYYFSVSLWNELGEPYSVVWDWRVSRAGPGFLLI